MTIDDNILSKVREGLDLPGEPSATRVVVAMSGGVDSSVTAGLLRELGYDVVGITLQLYDHGMAAGRKGACCAGADIHDARRVASKLAIAHYVLDYEWRFREAVIDDFVESYIAGETPVPCVRCNQTVKFTDLIARAKALGAAALATGHYARRVRRADDRIDLLTPEDSARDQSYFLFATTPEQLGFLRFPLGGLTKAETRRAAAALGLEVATKPDSQDICFVPHGRYGDIIARLRPEAVEPGDIVHIDGRVLGRHEGIVHFTVGQRRGLKVSGPEPLYVVRIDAGRREVAVGPRSALQRREVRLKDVNWLGDRSQLSGNHPLPVHVKIRSTRPPVPASLRLAGTGGLVRIAEAESGVAPGQVCVFYERPGKGARVLGGGFIAGTSEGTEAPMALSPPLIDALPAG